jgi:6-phosphogluconolactonase
VAAANVELHVAENHADLVGDLIAEQARAGGSIVLTGGTTPAPAYRRAASVQPDWSSVTVWFGDERCVPPDDERSNYLLAKHNLLDLLERQPNTVHRIRGELQPADAAGELDRALHSAELDLLLLGLGPDGHVASLFPGSPQLDVESHLATSGPAGLEPWVDRVTMTMPALLSARRIVVHVAGADKADAVAGAFGGGISREIPASLLLQAPVPVEVWSDEAAAAKIRR